MITFKLNNKELKIPSSWDDVTFKQYLALMDMDDNIYFLLALFTGIEESVWRSPKTMIANLDQVIETLSFLQEAPNFGEYTGKIGSYQLPKDITLECPAQFEDMRQVRAKPGTDKEQIERFAHYVAIYLQKVHDGEYDNIKAEAMISDVMNMPAKDVMVAGAFFFIKLSNLKTNTTKIFQTQPTTQKKSKWEWMSSIKDLARRLHLTGFHVKPESARTNYSSNGR